MEPLKKRESDPVTRTGINPAKNAGFKGLIAAQIEGSEKKNEKKQESGECKAHCEKKLELITEEGIVKFIRVFCSCGEVTQIECDYGE